MLLSLYLLASIVIASVQASNIEQEQTLLAFKQAVLYGQETDESNDSSSRGASTQYPTLQARMFFLSWGKEGWSACYWSGVTCQNQNVIQLKLKDLGLRGSIRVLSAPHPLTYLQLL